MVKKLLPPGVLNMSRRVIRSTLLGDSMTWTKYSQETDGAYIEVHCKIQPGYANPAHYHTRFRESFTVTSGTLTVGLNGEKLQLSPKTGTTTVNLGDIHSLENASNDQVEFVSRLEPGDEGFERAMYIMHGIANDGGSAGDGVPRNPVVASLLIEMMDARLVGWAWWLASPLLALLRRGGRGMGLEEKLVRTYWLEE